MWSLIYIYIYRPTQTGEFEVGSAKATDSLLGLQKALHYRPPVKRKVYSRCVHLNKVIIIIARVKITLVIRIIKGLSDVNIM